MPYKLAFLDSALKEWRKLSPSLQDAFKRKLAERLLAPAVPSARLYGSQNRYKIKLRSAGYRLVYEIRDLQCVIVVIAVGRRDKDSVYRAAEKR